MLETQAAIQGADKFQIYNLVKREPRAGLAEDVRRGLSSQPKRFLPKYFYDQLGSQLFEAICLLPEYGLTRADTRLLQKHAEEMMSRMPTPTHVAELGSGSGKKTRMILEVLSKRQRTF